MDNVIDKAREYVRLKDEAGQLNKKLSALRKELIPELEKNEWYISMGNGYTLELEERISYDYDPWRTEEALLPLHLWQPVAQVVVDKKKFEGLVKAKLITEEIAKRCKRIVRTSKALVIKKEDEDVSSKSKTK